MVTRFEEGVKEKKEEYKTKTSRQKYLKNEDYRDFKEAIFVSLPSSSHLQRTSTESLSQQADHKDEAMPPMTTFIEKGMRALRFQLLLLTLHAFQNPGMRVTTMTTLRSEASLKTTSAR